MNFGYIKEEGFSLIGLYKYTQNLFSNKINHISFKSCLINVAIKHMPIILVSKTYLANTTSNNQFLNYMLFSSTLKPNDGGKPTTRCKEAKKFRLFKPKHDNFE